MEKEYYRKFKNLEKCFVVRACEGDGTSEFPYEEVKYVYDENLNLIGIIETDDAKEKFNPQRNN